jgi:hypothetical protein
MVCESLVMFCTFSRLSDSPTGLDILLSVSARMVSFYGHSSLPAVSRRLSEPLSSYCLARCRCHLSAWFNSLQPGAWPTVTYNDWKKGVHRAEPWNSSLVIILMFVAIIAHLV